MSLTLKKFRELTKTMDENTVINTTIEFGNPNSIRGTISEIHLAPNPKYTYSKEAYITLTQFKGNGLNVKVLTGKNLWEKL